MSDKNSYQKVWNKYLPVIILKLRNAIKSNEAQTLNIDKYDFEDAGRKTAAYKFNVEMKEGRALYDRSVPAIARDFAKVITEDTVAKEIVRTGHFSFNMNNKFALTIQKNNPIPVEDNPSTIEPVEQAVDVPDLGNVTLE